VHLVVIGGFTSQALPQAQADAFRAELMALAERRGIAGAVTFTGYLPAEEVSEALHGCDVAALPFCEGVTTKSGALLTALAHRLPTAVTVPARPDPELVDGQTVALIDARRDAAAVARTVDLLLRDEVLRRRLAGGGERLVARRRWDHIAAAHRALYEGLVADAR
jgi:glycosyltransferase involved in cell wall biosynthesis